MRKIISALLFCVLLATASLTAAAASVPRLTLTVDAQAVCVGQSLTVTLALSDDLPDVGSLEVHLYYDASALDFVRAQAGKANAALRPILPDGARAYTGVLFVYDYGQDVGADRSFAAESLLTAEFTVRADAQADKLPFSVDCVAAFDTAFRPLSIAADAGQTVRLAHPQIRIRNYTPTRTVDYRTTLTLYAQEVEDAVPGGTVCWMVDGAQSQTGPSIQFAQMRRDVTVQAVYRVNGTIAAQSDTEIIHVKSGFFDRLIAFFRGLFGTLRNIEQSLFS